MIILMTGTETTEEKDRVFIPTADNESNIKICTKYAPKLYFEKCSIPLYKALGKRKFSFTKRNKKRARLRQGAFSELCFTFSFSYRALYRSIR